MSKQPAIVIPEGCERVLLHACCAPCSSAIVEWLLAHGVEPVIYYYNPNIYPYEEYEKRKNESKRHAESLGIKWIEDNSQFTILSPQGARLFHNSQCTNYESAHEAWLEAVKGLENEPERGKRCAACFYHRLQATARKAEELGIPFFATTLASSRWKNLEQINAAGREAEEEAIHNSQCTMHNAQFWAQNWRKDGLQERRNELLKEYGFYNQTYCGCEFSRRER